MSKLTEDDIKDYNKIIEGVYKNIKLTDSPENVLEYVNKAKLMNVVLTFASVPDMTIKIYLFQVTKDIFQNIRQLENYDDIINKLKEYIDLISKQTPEKAEFSNLKTYIITQAVYKNITRAFYIVILYFYIAKLLNSKADKAKLTALEDVKPIKNRLINMQKSIRKIVTNLESKNIVDNNATINSITELDKEVEKVQNDLSSLVEEVDKVTTVITKTLDFFGSFMSTIPEPLSLPNS